MRILASLVTPFALLACACSSTSPSSNPTPADQPAAQPTEVEGPAPTTEPAAASDESMCMVNPSPSVWTECEGQRVRLQGSAAEQVMQHPVLVPPDQHQGYMDVEDVQLIVLTKAAFDCSAAMSVVGTLRSVDMGGEPGSKDSYKGWAIEDATVTCE